MASKIPQNFKDEQEAAIASFDFTSIIAGRGCVDFEGFVSRDNATNDHHFSDVATFSEETETDGSVQTFDTFTFNMPRIIEGDAFLNMTWGIDKPGSGSSGYSEGYWTIQFQKWDGTTATDLGSSTRTRTMKTATTASATFIARASVLKVTLPRTHFKINVNLRITFTVTGTGNVGPVWYIATNPQNTDTTKFTVGQAASTGGGAVGSSITATTRLIASIPFRIDL